MLDTEALESYLDQFYLGSFSLEQIPSFLGDWKVEWIQGAFVFYYLSQANSPRDLPLSGCLVLTSFLNEDLETFPNWRALPEISSSYLFEKLIRCAVVAVRAQPKSRDWSPCESLVQDLKNFVGENSRLVHETKSQMINFQRQDKAIRLTKLGQSIPTQNQDELPQRLKEWLLDLELSSLRVTPKQKLTKTNRAAFGIQVELRSHSLLLMPVILPYKENGSSEFSKAVPMTRYQLNRYQIENFPKSLEPFLNSHLNSQEQKSSDRLRKDQWTELIQFPLRNCLDDIHPSQLVLKQGSELQTLNLISDGYLEIQCLPCRLREDRLSFRIQQFTSDSQARSKAQNSMPYSLESQDYIYLLFETSYQSNLFRIPKLRATLTILEFLSSNPQIPASAFDALAKHLESLQSDHLRFNSKIIPRYEIEIQPIPVVKLLDPAQDSFAYLHLDFNYQKALNNYLIDNPCDGVVEAMQLPEFEKVCKQFLLSWNNFSIQRLPSSIRKLGYFFDYQLGSESYREFVANAILDFLERGFEFFHVRLQKPIRSSQNLHYEISAEKNKKWLHVKLRIKDRMDDNLILDEDLIRDGFVNGSKSELVAIDANNLAKLLEIQDLIEELDSKVPESLFAAFSAYFGNLIIEPALFKALRKNEQKLKELTHPKRVELPLGFRLPLRPYQLQGYYFLKNLKRTKHNGILADDMGLGKTAQTLCFLLSEFENNPKAKFLVIAPLSSLDNWEQEIKKFCPTFPVQLYHGQNRFYSPIQEGLTLTSYGTARNDSAVLAKIKWEVITLDEAQAIKNPKSQLSRALRKIPATNRVCLTGTPIENSTMELWALFEFLMPGFLGNRRWFQRTFLKPIERNRASLTSQALRTVIQPFMLRRKKSEVEKELPEKSETLIRLKMESDQAKAYEQTAKFYTERIKRQIQDTGIENAGMYVLEGILRLRQVCIDPRVANPEFENLSSSKINYLLDTLPQLAANNHKVLVFSQFSTVLSQLSEELKLRGYQHSYLDGQVSRKQRIVEIESFQNEEERHFFLISLKAGGVALNLTAADYVVLLDPWWNPAVENQAIDRAHRIGQQKQVMVYRLVIQDSIEEKVLELSQKKQEIFSEVVEGATSKSPLEIRELMNLLDVQFQESSV